MKSNKGIYTVKLGDGRQYDYHMNEKHNSFMEVLQDGKHVKNMIIAPTDYDRIVNKLKMM